MKRDIVLDKDMQFELEKIEHEIKEVGLGYKITNSSRFREIFEKMYAEKPRIVICATDGVKHEEIDQVLNCHDNCIYKSIKNKQKNASVWQYTMVISSDTEYGYEEKKEIESIQALGGRVFSFLIFPNKILLPDSEVSYVNSVRENAQKCTSFHAALSISKNLHINASVYLRILFDIIQCYYLLDRIGELSHNEKVHVDDLLSIYDSESYSDWEKMSFFWHIEGHRRLVQCCVEICSSLSGVVEQLKNLYFRYAEKCRCELIEERFSVKNVSDFAADLLIKYGLVQEKVNSYISMLVERYFHIFDYQSQEEIRISRRELEKIPEVAFIGGFSSGKTSFINWVLDMTDGHELRTSGGHNTAILTYIKGSEENEMVETVYKHGQGCFRWKLFYVSETKECDIYSGPDNARVAKIDTYNGRVIFDYFGDKFSQVLNYSEYGMNVKKGDLVRKGDKLTKTSYSEENILFEKMNVSFRPDEEYENIIDAIKKHHLIDVEVTIKYIPSSNRIRRLETYALKGKNAIRIIKRIQSLHSEIGCENIRLSEIREAFWKVDYLPSLSFFTNVDIKATCKMNDARELLNEKTWIKYSGNVDTGVVSYSETPAGYLYTDYMSYYLNKGFLKYVEIVDTPGLGSISDEHDAITERYIRGSVDTLLVMIKIDRQSVQESRRKFIFNIAEIFEKSHRNKNNVFFVCNIWSSVFQGKAERDIAKQYCDEYYKLIQDAGFVKDNFFVIDMRKMQMGERHETFFEYPSDIQFRENFLMNVSNLGICNALKKITLVIENILEETRKRIMRRSSELKSNKNYRNERIEKLKRAKQSLLSVKMREFSVLFPDDVYRELNDLANDIASRTTVKDWKKKKEYLIDTVTEIENLMKDSLEVVENEDGKEDYYDDICQEFILINSKMDRILFELNQQNGKDIRDSPTVVGMIKLPNPGMVKFPYLSLRKMIENHYSNYQSWIHFIKNGQLSENGADTISAFILCELEKCFIDNKHNYDLLLKRLQEKQKTYTQEIENEIKRLSKVDDSTEQKILVDNLKNLEIVQRTWKTAIVPKLKEAEIIV